MARYGSTWRRSSLRKARISESDMMWLDDYMAPNGFRYGGYDTTEWSAEELYEAGLAVSEMTLDADLDYDERDDTPNADLLADLSEEDFEDFQDVAQRLVNIVQEEASNRGVDLDESPYRTRKRRGRSRIGKSRFSRRGYRSSLQK